MKQHVEAAILNFRTVTTYFFYLNYVLLLYGRGATMFLSNAILEFDQSVIWIDTIFEKVIDIKVITVRDLFVAVSE